LDDAWIALTFPGKQQNPRVKQRALIERPAVWDRPGPTPAVDQSGHYDFAPFKQNTPMFTQGRILETFTDAYLRWSDCFFLGSEFQSYFDDSAEIYARVLAEREFGSERQRVSQIVVHDGRLALPKSALENPIEVDGKVLWGTPHEPRNWGLWLLQSLPAVAHFVRNRGQYSKLFIHAAFPTCREMLPLLGVSEQDIIWHDLLRAYHFREVDLLRESRWFFYVFGRDRRLFRDLAARARASAGATARRIFISRLSYTRRGAYRGLLNEAELIDALAPLGFIAIEPEKLSAIEQIRTFAGAEAVIGLGGAGMFNTVFCRAGTRVLDIESSPIFVEAHSNIFASVGLRYGVLIGTEDPADKQLYNRNWTVDIDNTVALVRRMFNL